METPANPKVIKLRCKLPIRMDQEEIRANCQALGLTYVRHTADVHWIVVEVAEDMDAAKRKTVTETMLQQTLATLITLEY
jgi:hypothetical protein